MLLSIRPLQGDLAPTPPSGDDAAWQIRDGTRGGASSDAIRIALGAAQDRAALERGLSLLATVLPHGPGVMSSML
jgi:hypothetical protein